MKLGSLYALLIARKAENHTTCILCYTAITMRQKSRTGPAVIQLINVSFIWASIKWKICLAVVETLFKGGQGNCKTSCPVIFLLVRLSVIFILFKVLPLMDTYSISFNMGNIKREINTFNSCHFSYYKSLPNCLVNMMHKHKSRVFKTASAKSRYEAIARIM